MVSVDCDSSTCNEGIVLHARGEEISVQWLNDHLVSAGWTRQKSSDTGLEYDVCPTCSRSTDQNPS